RRLDGVAVGCGAADGRRVLVYRAALHGGAGGDRASDGTVVLYRSEPPGGVAKRVAGGGGFDGVLAGGDVGSCVVRSKYRKLQRAVREHRRGDRAAGMDVRAVADRAIRVRV